MEKIGSFKDDVIVQQDSMISPKLKWAMLLRKISFQFAWPVLIIYLLAPKPEVSFTHGSIYYVILGAPVMFCGLIIRLWSKGYQKKEGFVHDGPYRYVANPVELGALFVYIGGAVFMGLSWWYVLFLIVATIVYLNFCSLAYDHEQMVAQGSPYERYRKRVRRWWPMSLPGVNKSHRTYSLHQAFYLERWSLLWVLGFAAVLAIRINVFKY